MKMKTSHSVGRNRWVSIIRRKSRPPKNVHCFRGPISSSSAHQNTTGRNRFDLCRSRCASYVWKPLPTASGNAAGIDTRAPPAARNATPAAPFAANSQPPLPPYSLSSKLSHTYDHIICFAIIHSYLRHAPFALLSKVFFFYFNELRWMRGGGFELLQDGAGILDLLVGEGW